VCSFISLLFLILFCGKADIKKMTSARSLIAADKNLTAVLDDYIYALTRGDAEILFGVMPPDMISKECLLYGIDDNGGVYDNLRRGLERSGECMHMMYGGDISAEYILTRIVTPDTDSITEYIMGYSDGYYSPLFERDAHESVRVLCGVLKINSDGVHADSIEFAACAVFDGERWYIAGTRCDMPGIFPTWI